MTDFKFQVGELVRLPDGRKATVVDKYDPADVWYVVQPETGLSSDCPQSKLAPISSAPLDANGDGL